MNIRSGDLVMMLNGKDRGKKGKVVKTHPAENKVVVEKLNMVKKHLKSTSAAPHGGIKEVERAVLIAKVMLICPHCGQPTRVSHTLAGNEKYVRICSKCREVIDVTAKIAKES